MRTTLIMAGLFVALALGMLITDQPRADAAQAPQNAATLLETSAGAPGWDQDLEPLSKRCSFNSDCSHGTCKQGKCGGCSFNSDCKGWGKCANGWCGACSFSSECKGFGNCSSGRCTKSPY